MFELVLDYLILSYQQFIDGMTCKTCYNGCFS